MAVECVVDDNLRASLRPPASSCLSFDTKPIVRAGQDESMGVIGRPPECDKGASGNRDNLRRQRHSKFSRIADVSEAIPHATKATLIVSDHLLSRIGFGHIGRGRNKLLKCCCQI